MVRTTCFPDPITSLWWQTAGAHRETAKLDIVTEDKARAFNVVVCKLWTLKMSGSPLHTEKQKGKTNVWMFILHMKLSNNYTVFRKTPHTPLSSAVRFDPYPLNHVTTTKRKPNQNKTNKTPTSPPQCKAIKDLKCHIIQGTSKWVMWEKATIWTPSPKKAQFFLLVGKSSQMRVRRYNEHKYSTSRKCGTQRYCP